jgi:hypothetical protein
MARSDLLHEGPDTEEQDQCSHSADSACNARPVHTVVPLSGSGAAIVAAYASQSHMFTEGNFRPS